MAEISIMPAIRISTSGLDAESRRMEVLANNVANAQTTRNAYGQVYRRKEVIFSEQFTNALHASPAEKMLNGVRLTDVVEDPRPPQKAYRPGHPDANAEGYVTLPNINIVEEMVDMMSASRNYQANLKALSMARDMAGEAMNIMK